MIAVSMLISVGTVDAQSPNPDLLTVAEKSDFKNTATYEEVMATCRKLAESNRVHLTTMGRTSQARSLPLLVVGNSPPESPQELREKKYRDKLVVFVLGNIHAGEVCGKEAI